MGLSEQAPQPYKESSETDISAQLLNLKTNIVLFFVAEDFFPLGTS